MKKFKEKSISADRYKLSHKLEIYSFILPLVIVMTLFLAYPILKTLLMSFQDWDLNHNNLDRDFVDWKNYISVIKDKYFNNTVMVTLKYMLITVLGRYLLGLIVALILQQNFRGTKIFKSLIIITWAVPEVIAAFIWVLMYNRDIGIINEMLKNLGFITKGLEFLQNKELALPAAMLVNIWKGYPFVAIMLHAGMQSIPTELYEAARLDGASTLQEIKNITFPLLTPVSSIVFLLLITWTMRDFGICYVLAEGGPVHATELFTIFIYTKAFRYNDMGAAAAAGVMMLLVCTIFTTIYLQMIERRDRT